MSRHGLRRGAGTGAAVLALILFGTGVALADPNDPEAARSAAGVDTSRVIVQLSGEPLATAAAVERSGNDKVDFTSPRTRGVRDDLATQRTDFRAWLRDNAPEARITSEFDVALHGVAVDLNGTPISEVRRAPGVVAAAYENLYTPTDSQDPGLALINAVAGWTEAGARAGGPADWAGSGIRVGVIDSGIDATHPCFAPDQYEPVQQAGDSRYTTDKVIVARVFNETARQYPLDARAVGAHGTHVAGTIACNLDTPVAGLGAQIPHAVSGVAPGALLGSYNVFPGTVEAARSEDLLNALDAAAEDGMDVINMSLGGPANGNRDLLTSAVDNLDRAGIVVAVSAGNDGPGYFSVGSPGSAERALTAGATSVGHGMFVPVAVAGSEDLGARGVIGDFPTPGEAITANLGVVRSGKELGHACAELVPGSLEGEIALIARGDCTFGEKVFHAEEAGAEAVVVVNDADGAIQMAPDAAFETSVPAVMVGGEFREDLVRLDGRPVTMGGPEYVRTGLDDALMDFSSTGPTDVDHRVKPDVVAPGGGVLSAVPGGWAFRDGTSLAASHLAGAAAVIRAANPGWSAWQVRSAIVNTAQRGAVSRDATEGAPPETDIQKIGAGLVDLAAATASKVALSSPSISFGMLPSGSGRLVTTDVTITNLTDSRLALRAEVDDSTTREGDFDISTGGDLELPPEGSVTVTVSFRAPRGAQVGGTQAVLLLKDGTGDALAHAALYAYLR